MFSKNYKLLSFGIGVILIFNLFVINTHTLKAQENTSDKIIQDAYATNNKGEDLDVNYGDEESLLINSHPKNPSIAFLKFDVSDIDKSVKNVKVIVSVVQGGSELRHTAEAVYDDSWDESSITWNNKPQSSGEVLATWKPIFGEQFEIDVTHMVKKAVKDDGMISIMISTLDPEAFGDIKVGYASTEYAKEYYQPRLVYTYRDDNKKGIKKPESYEVVKDHTKMIIGTSKDTFVRNGIYSDENFGLEEEFIVKNISKEDYTREALLQFNLKDVTSIPSEAILKLHMTLAGDNAPYQVAQVISEDDWSEVKVTWDSRPKPDGNIIGMWEPVEGQCIEIDVTDAVSKALQGNKKFSINIGSKQLSKDFESKYASNENPNESIRPKLELHFDQYYIENKIEKAFAYDGENDLDQIYCSQNEDITSKLPNKAKLYFENGHIGILDIDKDSWKGIDTLTAGNHIITGNVATKNGTKIATVDVKINVYTENQLDQKVNNFFENIVDSLTYEDLLNIKGGRKTFIDKKKKVEYDLYLLDGVMSDDEIRQGIKDYMLWYYGKNKINYLVSSLSDITDKSEVNLMLAQIGETKTIEQIIEDYKHFKFLHIYLRRWMDITVDGKLLADEIIYGTTDFMDLAIPHKEFITKLMKYDESLNEAFASAKSDQLFSHNNILKYSNNCSIDYELVEKFITKISGKTDYDKWFKDNFKGTIVEYKNKPYTTYSYVRASGNRYLPLLTVKSPQVALVTTRYMMTYTSKGRYSDEELIEIVAKSSQNLIDTYYRIMPDYNKYASEAYDKGKSVFVYGSDTTDDYSDENNRLIQEVYAPVNWTKFKNTRPSANGANVIYGQKDATAAAVAHEFGGHTSEANGFHGYIRSARVSGEDISVFMNGKERFRQNLADEYYSDEEAEENGRIDGELFNRSCERFQSEEDWREYFRGLWENNYFFDVVWAHVMLENPELRYGILANYKYPQDGSMGYYSLLTDEEIDNLTLETLWDFIDNGLKIVSRPDLLDISKNNANRIETYNANFHANPADWVKDYGKKPYNGYRVFRMQNILYRYGWQKVAQFMGTERDGYIGTKAQSDDEAMEIIFGKNLKEWYYEEFKRIEKMAMKNDIGGIKFDEWKELVKLFKDPTKLKLLFAKYGFDKTNEYRIQLIEYNWDKNNLLIEIKNLHNEIVAEDNQDKYGVDIIQNDLELKKGDTLKLQLSTKADVNNENKAVWISSDNDVVLVDENGLITAKSNGTATVYVFNSLGADSIMINVR